MTHNGSSLTKKPGEIFGVKGFLAVIKARPRGPLIAALKILMATEGYNDNREIWENAVLMPLLMALTERPAALANPAFSEALAGFDIWQMIDDDHVQRRARQRIGEKYPPKSETWRAGVLEWLDKAFPARMALPSPSKMNRQETLAHIGKIGSGA